MGWGAVGKWLLSVLLPAATEKISDELAKPKKKRPLKG